MKVILKSKTRRDFAADRDRNLGHVTQSHTPTSVYASNIEKVRIQQRTAFWNNKNGGKAWQTAGH